MIFAYTIKARGLPTQGHPANHSALMSDEQWAQLARRARRRRRRPVGRRSPPGTPEAELCRRAAERLQREPLPVSASRAPCRATSGACTRAAPRRSRRSGASSSTSRAPTRSVAKRVVTVSPDVASSTNLGGWINRAGVWNMGERIDWFADDAADAHALARVVARPAHRARHRRGQPRRPARRARRDLVARRPAAAADRRALRPVRQPRARAVVVRHLRRRPVDPRRHAVRRHARARGRRAPVDHHARRSASSSRAASPGSPPSARISSGRCSPRSASLGHRGGTSAYFRLSTRPIDQALAALPASRRARERAPPRRCSPAATCCGEPERAPDVTLVGMGAVLPDVLAAADELAAARPRGRRRLPHLRRPRLPRAAGAAGPAATAITRSSTRSSRPSGARRSSRVLDGHPHTLAFLSAIRCVPIASLGVSDFGQSGDVPGSLRALRHRRRDDHRRRARPDRLSA